VRADNYAVLVAGSNTYGNYRHQADVCHAYKMLRRYGIPETNILTFIFDDIALDPMNPFPGRLFNHPTNNMTKGIDVYQGCGGSIEANVFRGADVIPDVFMAVITGNKTGVPKGKSVLQSTSRDDVFINFVDHGGPGTIYFPGFIPFQATTLNAGLKTMVAKKMFNKLVFYLEACEAGSIFEKQLDPSIEIYAVTASNADESSWGTYCPGEEALNGGAMVDGVDLESCLGDLFSVNWMEDADLRGVRETLEAQFLTVQNRTDMSHVMQYGDVSYTGLPTGTFIASMSQHLRHAQIAQAEQELTRKNSVPSRDIPLHILYTKYKKTAAGASKRFAMKRLAEETAMRVRVDEVFETFAELAVKSASESFEKAEELFMMPSTPIIHDTCMNQVEDVWRGSCGGWNEYSTQYGAVIINACRMYNNGPVLAEHMITACAE